MMNDPSHPGEILREDVIEELGITVTDAAERLGIARVTLSRVLHCHAAISPNLAIRLELAGASTARASLAMESPYDLAQARKNEHPGIRQLAQVG